jgi:hypothetical protein
MLKLWNYEIVDFRIFNTLAIISINFICIYLGVNLLILQILLNQTAALVNSETNNFIIL